MGNIYKNFQIRYLEISLLIHSNIFLYWSGIDIWVMVSSKRDALRERLNPFVTRVLSFVNRRMHKKRGGNSDAASEHSDIHVPAMNANKSESDTSLLTNTLAVTCQNDVHLVSESGTSHSRSRLFEDTCKAPSQGSLKLKMRCTSVASGFSDKSEDQSRAESDFSSIKAVEPIGLALTRSRPPLKNKNHGST